jgi:putative pyruvate formate lyase activating enzyme
MRRSLYLAPPYLVDDYIPRYHLLSSVDTSKKRSLAYAHLRECNLCPRLCGVNRYEKTGVCLIGAETVKVGTIAPHFGEEPFIQGHNGSGSVFFSGCNLRCVFCQVCAARTEDARQTRLLMLHKEPRHLAHA